MERRKDLVEVDCSSFEDLFPLRGRERNQVGEMGAKNLAFPISQLYARRNLQVSVTVQPGLLLR